MTQEKYTGRTLDGKYRVRELLGEGGMGSVYRGEHLLIGRKVAVKFLHESLLGNEEAVKRFYQEGQAAASIDHRNVIDILDMGVSPQGEPYLVMEYLEGEGLADLVGRGGPLDLPCATGILEQILAALGAAHERGIVHRDLKPDNIFLERQRGGAPGIKLIDFGISKLARDGVGTALTRDGSMLGTPAYMSPEQVRNAKDVDHRTDVYAAGAIFYEMLTGAPPFEGEHYSEILSAVLTGPPRDPRELRADFPPAAWIFIERAMAKDPGERFGSVDEMLDALAKLVPTGERAARLTLLGADVAAGSFAVGDLGPMQAAGDTVLASEVLGRMVEERVGVPTWKRLARRVIAGLWLLSRASGALIARQSMRLMRWVAAGLRPRVRALGALIATAPKRLFRRAATDPRLSLRLAVAAFVALLVLLLVALCSGGSVETDPGKQPPEAPTAGPEAEPETEEKTDPKPPRKKKKRRTTGLPWQK